MKGTMIHEGFGCNLALESTQIMDVYVSVP